MTLDDLRDSRRKSGFKYVVPAGNKTGWQASRNGGGRPDGWRGPLRKTPEEAAQDYIAYVEGLPPLTPDDLLSVKCKSGYRLVGFQQDKARKQYHAQIMNELGSRKNWYGPWRDTAREAAQDACDHVNEGRAAPPATLKTAGHEYVVDERDTDPEYQAALGVIRDRTAQRRTTKQGYVYLIIEIEEGGALRYGKIGYSVNPKKRVAELQTGNPRPLKLHALKRGTEADEKGLHAKYISDNVLQEWFRLDKELLLEFPLNPDGVTWADAARDKKETTTA